MLAIGYTAGMTSTAPDPDREQPRLPESDPDDERDTPPGVDPRGTDVPSEPPD